MPDAVQLLTEAATLAERALDARLSRHSYKVGVSTDVTWITP